MYKIKMYEDKEFVGYLGFNGLPYAKKTRAKTFHNKEDAEWFGNTICEEMNSRPWNGKVSCDIEKV